MKRHTLPIAVAALLACAASTAQAVPYASCITNNAGTVSFLLNESADKVRIVLDGGANSIDLGARGKGAHSFSLGGAASYEIRVSKSTTPAWTQTSDDNSPLVRFFSGRGVTVNNYPSKLELFGRVYVSNGSAGTSTVAPAGSNRNTPDGIYILNPDLSDAFGRGNTASTTGLNFVPAAQPGNTPWRIEVGPDGNLYIADYSTTTGTIFRTDPAVTTNVMVLAGQGTGANARTDVHTTIGSLIVRGSLETGDLVIYGNDGNFPGGFNKIMRWNIQGGPFPYESAPEILGSVYNSVAQLNPDLHMGPDGKIYALVNRSTGTDADSIKVYDTDGVTLLWGSLSTGGSPDPLRAARGLRVSPDGKLLAIIRDDNKIMFLNLVNGIPDLASTNLFDAFNFTGTAGRAVTFDVAGNLYAISSGAEKLRVFSPGGTTEAVTRSDGTFQMVAPETSVSVTATDALATETGGDNGEFTITRTGNTVPALTVFYSISGTASNSSDYTTLSGSVQINAGEATAVIPVSALDDATAEIPETVILTLSPGTNYALSLPGEATVTIADTETPRVTIAALTTNMYEGTLNDTMTFQLTRSGDTNSSLAVNIAYSGGAGVEDLSSPVTQVAMNAGVVTQTFTISPQDDANVEGVETITVTVAPGDVYLVGTINSSSGVIVDNDLGPETTTFAANFESSDEANGWTVRFGAQDGTDDKVVEFGYDYSANGFPLYPYAGTGRGLKLTVNKNDSVASAAGVNVYPASLNLAGDYLVRFAMLLEGVNGASTTEYATFGINHSGAKTNWVIQSTATGITGPTGGDGLWFKLSADGSGFIGGLDVGLLSAPNDSTLPIVLAAKASTNLTHLFKSPPFRAAGVPANFQPNPAGNLTPNWVDVEISQVGGVITLKMNNDQILRYTNTTAYTSGALMFGYNDSFASVAGGTGGDAARGFVIYDNLRVIQLTSPPAQTAITNIKIVGSNVEITFSGAASDSASSFTVQSSAVVASGYTNDGTAVIAPVSSGVFKATLPLNGAVRFYRISR